MARLITPAVVLRTVDYGEADRVVTLFARDVGKVAALARGARRSTRRFGAGLSLFGVGEATLNERPNADLDALEAFHAARGFPQLLADVAKMAHASYACELVRELSPQRQAEPQIFDLLVGALDLLDGAAARAETLRVFELALLGLVGLRPELERCLGCDGGDEVLDQAGQVLDVRRGGVVCAGCHGHGRPLDGQTRRALVGVQATRLDQAAQLSLAPSLNAGCREALTTLICDHLGRPLKSLEFILKLNGAQAARP